MMLAGDEAEAIERGIDGAHFFGYSLGHYYGMAEHTAGVTDVYQQFQERRDHAGFARHIVRPDQAPLAVRLLQAGVGSLRGAIGTPDQITQLINAYAQAGVDQVIFVLQAGRNRHEHICESLELFADAVMPRFAEGREAREKAKADRLRGAIDAAIARREPPRGLRAPYLIDEAAELARAQRRRRPRPPTAHEFVALAAEQARIATRAAATKLLARAIGQTGDVPLERRFSSKLVQRMLFTALARSYEPEAAGGFQGSLAYELSRPATGARSLVWTIHVVDGAASARPGAPANPNLTVRYRLTDFLRMAAGTLDPAVPLLDGRAEFDGDLALAARLPEMFGAASPY
jgi:hypothetical protein